MTVVFHFPNAQFSKVWTKNERIVEAQPDRDSRNWGITSTEVNVPTLLACLCRAVEFGRVGIPDFDQVPVGGNSDLSSLRSGSVGI